MMNIIEAIGDALTMGLFLTVFGFFVGILCGVI